MTALDRLWRRIQRLGRPAPPIVVRPVMGLANRLRAVTSCVALSRRLELPFAMFWESGEGFSDDAFGDLFANDWPSIGRERYEGVLAASAIDLRAWVAEAEASNPRPAPDRMLDEIRRRGLVWQRGFNNVDKVLARGGVAGLRRLRQMRHAVCRELVPAAKIAARVDAFAAEHFGDARFVGVHVRRGDALDGPRAESHRRSSDEAFAAAMERRIADDPDVRFFLATDCEKTQASFVKHFGGRVLTAPKEFVPSVFDAPKEGQADACVELFLLARTEEVIGTYARTFGRMAAHIGGVRFLEAGVEA